jgi:hypothetical protein
MGTIFNTILAYFAPLLLCVRPQRSNCMLLCFKLWALLPQRPHRFALCIQLYTSLARPACDRKNTNTHTKDSQRNFGECVCVVSLKGMRTRLKPGGQSFIVNAWRRAVSRESKDQPTIYLYYLNITWRSVDMFGFKTRNEDFILRQQ